MVASYIQGVGIGAGLIIAIGAQNVFVLTQGIRKQYQWIVPFICSFCDCILILVGTAGMGAIISANPTLGKFAGWGGAIFLIWYGGCSLRSAFRDGRLESDNVIRKTLKSVILTTLALTLLNPHVYLDTVVLLGSISGQFEGMKRFAFALGACSASVCWFFTLSYAGSLLQPVFKRPITWKVLDIIIWLTMWILAYCIWPKGSI